MVYIGIYLSAAWNFVSLLARPHCWKSINFLWHENSTRTLCTWIIKKLKWFPCNLFCNRFRARTTSLLKGKYKPQAPQLRTCERGIPCNCVRTAACICYVKICRYAGICARRRICTWPLTWNVSTDTGGFAVSNIVHAIL